MPSPLVKATIQKEGGDLIELSRAFSYIPATRRKRQTLIETDGNVIIQRASGFVERDILIPWTLPAACFNEYIQLYELFVDDTDPTYTFTGYWNDQYEIRFHEFDQPEVRARLFNLSGSFHVLEIVEDVQED